MSYNGTKLGQDIRFKDPDKDILISMKTPKIFSTTVSKQNIIILPIIKLWLNQQIFEFLEFEDETLVNLIINLINSSPDKIDPKNIQYQISGFLGDKTYSFMKKFWKLLINVQECYLEDKYKIPSELIPLKIEYDKQQSYKKFDRYKEYENNFNKNNNYKYNNDNDNEDKTKIELMEIIDSYKKDERYKNKYREKIRSRSRNKSRSREKRKYKSNSQERKKDKDREKDRDEYYKYKSNSKNRRRHKRYRSKSLSSYDNSDIEKRKYKKERDYEYKYENKRRKYSKDYSDSDDYDYHIKKHYHDSKKDYSNKKYNKSISSSDSSETFKI